MTQTPIDNEGEDHGLDEYRRIDPATLVDGPIEDVPVVFGDDKMPDIDNQIFGNEVKPS